MNRLSTEQISRSIEEALTQVALGKPVILTRDGKDLAALVPLELWERLIEAEEDRQDAEDFRIAKEEAEREGYVSFDEVLAENGLTRETLWNDTES